MSAMVLSKTPFVDGYVIMMQAKLEELLSIWNKSIES